MIEIRHVALRRFDRRITSLHFLDQRLTLPKMRGVLGDIWGRADIADAAGS
jgi:hypothetical protein